MAKAEEACRVHPISSDGRVSCAEALALLALSGFVLLAGCLGSFEQVDAYVAALAAAVRGASNDDSVTHWLTRNAPLLALGWVLVGVAIARHRSRAWADVGQALLKLGVGLLLFEGCRLVVDRYRPGGAPEHPVPNSFPSGHVANAALCVVTAAYLVGMQEGRRDLLRAVVVAGGTLFVAAVSFTRIYFGLHWFSDVIASLLFGLMFAAALEARREMVQSARVTIVLALAFLYGAAACDLRVGLPSPPRGMYSGARR